MAKRPLSTAHRAFLRDVMELAWSLFRGEQLGPSPRTFSDALRGAWRWMKRQAERIAAQPQWAKGSRTRTVAFASMVQSPIRRGLTGPYKNNRAAWAGRTTLAVGL